MMKPYLSMLRNCTLYFFCLAFSLEMYSQTNGGFESWLPSGSPPPFDWMYPEGWTTNNATTEFTSAGVSRNTDAHSGTYAARLRTVNVFGELRSAQLVLGNCEISYPTYSVIVNTGGEDLPELPQSLSFYYKLDTGDPGESAMLETLIKRPAGGDEPDTVFWQTTSLPATDTYTKMEIQIPDVDIQIDTDSIVLSFTSNISSPLAQNTLWVDDVVIDFTSALKPVLSVAENVLLFPNPVSRGDVLHLAWENKDYTSIEILNINGINHSHDCVTQILQHGADISTDPLAPGMYCVKSGSVLLGRFVIID